MLAIRIIRSESGLSIKRALISIFMATKGVQPT